MSRSIYSILNARYGKVASPTQRREFLKATLAASAGILISSTPAWARHCLGRDSKKRVVVIGAGFAGLSCAFELKSAGYEVTVLEARERVGGRVLSFNAANKNEFIKGRNIEGGAELIGSNHPAWVNYKELFKLQWWDVTVDEGEVSAPVILDGKLLSWDEGKRLWEEMKVGLGKMNELAASVHEDEPWSSPDAMNLDAMNTAAWIDSLEVSNLCKRGMWINQTSDNGQDADRQSLLGQLAAVKGGGLEKFWTDSEVYRCQGGNDSLARKLFEGIGADRVRKGSPATKISLHGDGVIVTTADGRTLECDDVVLAAPPTTWRKIEFNPVLPEAMKPQMGLNTKWLAHVGKRFWQDNNPKLSQYALTDGLIEQTWDATDAQGDVHESNGGACLTGFSGGPSVEKASAMGKEEREKAFCSLYEKLYPGFQAHKVNTRFMDWPKDPWSGASYSFPAPSQVTTVGPMLASSHMDGKLHIAGEHACYKFVGYMEGALNSGAGVSKRLAKRDGVLKHI